MATTTLLLFITTTISLFIQIHSTDDYYALNVDCAPHIDIISTHNNFAYIPYYVKLHRCQGKDLTDEIPFAKKCVPSNQSEVRYKVETLHSRTVRHIMLTNHTDCRYVCKLNRTSCTRGQGWNEDTCSCCSHDRECEGEFEWDRANCRCSCPPTSKTECGMKGKLVPTVPASLTKDGGIGVNTSKVVDPPPCVKYQLVIMIAVVELVVVILLCILVFYFAIMRKNEGGYNLSVRKTKTKNVATTENGQDSVINNNVGKSPGENQRSIRNETDNVRNEADNVRNETDNVSNETDNVRNEPNNIAVLYNKGNTDQPVFVIRNEGNS